MNEQVVFEQALRQPTEAEQLAYVAESCGDDVQLRQRVEVLLRAHDRAGRFLETPAAELPETVDFRPLLEGAGTVIGSYKLLQKIGEGGFGVVYLAEQEQPVRRQVALKIIKAGMDTREVIARFETERQALALMDHPHIAKVFDAGATASGRPYFVMELVQGVPITEFCDRNQLPLAPRLKLFCDVCHAIQHAHHKGIIHRDVKPSNVLVTLHEGKPVVKVIDFGVAKATVQKLTEKTLFTARGQMVGTPAYMSPEQAEMSGLDIDTRTDVYSLGVLLYELLTGTTPLDIQRLRAAGYAELQRLIREEEPPRPSHRIASLGGSAAILAASRGTDPRRLSRLLAGDLDCLVLKALEKDRNRRYATPGNFAEDILRYLHREPILARSPSALYKLGKFAQRNRAAVATAAGVLLILLAGMTGTTFGLIRAESRRIEAVRAWAAESAQRKTAVAEKKKAEQAEAETMMAYREGTDDAIGQLIAEKPDLGPNERTFLMNTLKRWQAFAARQGSDERSRAIRGQGHLRVALFLQRLGRQEESRAEWGHARGAFKELVTQFPKSRDYQLSLAACHSNLGVVLMELEHRDAAWAEFQACYDILQRLADQSPANEKLQELLASIYANRAILLKRQGQLQAARVEYQLALGIFRQLGRQFPEKPKYRHDLANLHTSLGMLLAVLKDDDAARAEFQAAREIQEALLAEFPANSTCVHYLAGTHGHLGDLHSRRGRTQEALAEYETASDMLKKLVEHLPGVAQYAESLAVTHINRAIVLRRLGRTDDARAEYEAALDIEKRLVEKFPTVPSHQEGLATAQTNLGNLLSGTGQLQEALAAYQSACDTWRRLVERFPEPHYQRGLGQAYNKLGLCLSALGKLQEAKAEYELAREVQNDLVGRFPDVTDYQVDLGGTCCNYGNLICDEGQPAQSLEWYDRAVEILEPVHENKPQHETAKRYLATTYENRAISYGQLRKPAEALQDLDRATKLSTPAEQQKLQTLRSRLQLQKFLEGVQKRIEPGNK